ncbi:DUF997 family protein [Romboutsia weinsteinii]|uniref:DUF997 family protein n=1 Tax=Romboutsia weinsteinii TaxID=2020949 RepID=A0A371J8L1_9FIRM|nr:YhdT family protein [Romboutsia weinsteinii]RDY29007.1 DUF997 family protein [Romboutsia weinsteinii]
MDNNKNSDTYEIIEDPRYKQCNKEALMGLGLGIINLVWWFGWGYGLGSKPVSEYTYILGFPAWFFMSCIVGGVLFSILTVIMINKFFKNMPLGPLSKEEVEEYRKDSSR